MTVKGIQGATPATALRTRATAPLTPRAPFQLHATQATTAVTPASPLDAFRKGEITRVQYVEAKVAHAMEHVQGLPAKQRAVIAEELRSRLVGGELAHLVAGVSA